MSVIKQFISNMRIDNNVSKIIAIYQELVWRESGYSIIPLKVEKDNQFWMKSQIDIYAIALNERDMKVVNERFDDTKIPRNRTIMDYAIDYVNHIKLKNKKQKEYLHDINRVRLYKGVFFPFELLGIDRNKLTNIYWNKDELSLIEWRWFQYEHNKSIL